MYAYATLTHLRIDLRTYGLPGIAKNATVIVQRNRYVSFRCCGVVMAFCAIPDTPSVRKSIRKCVRAALVLYCEYSCPVIGSSTAYILVIFRISTTGQCPWLLNFSYNYKMFCNSVNNKHIQKLPFLHLFVFFVIHCGWRPSVSFEKS